MTHLTFKRSQVPGLVLFLIPTLAVIIRIVPGPRIIDDAYITYRYVANILQGQGMVFNPGEWVLGTTTPIYTLLLSFLSWLFSPELLLPLPQLSCFINALLDGIGCWIIILIGKEINRKAVGLLTAGVWALAPFSVTFAVGGLETSLYVTLLLTIVYFCLTKHRNLAAIFSSIAFLTRPDAAILLGLVIWDRALSYKRDVEKIRGSEFAFWTIPVLIWLVVSAITYGSPIPHSIQAKIIAYHLGQYDGFIRILQHFATPFLEADLFGTTFIPFGLILYPYLYVIGLLTIKQSNRSAAILMLFPFLYLIVFAVANPLIFRWYLSPPTPFFIFVVFIGAQNILKEILLKTQPIMHSKWVSTGLSTIIMAIPILMSLAGWTIHPSHGSDRPAPKMSWIKLELQYLQAVSIIQQQILPSDTIGAADVGVIGYFSGARILDTVGLNSPGSLMYYPLNPEMYVINYAIPTELIIKEQPEWLIFLEAYGRETLLKDQDFYSLYQQIATIESDVYGSKGLLIYHLNKPPVTNK